jgi:hypothetical protein
MRTNLVYSRVVDLLSTFFIIVVCTRAAAAPSRILKSELLVLNLASSPAYEYKGSLVRPRGNGAKSIP